MITAPLTLHIEQELWKRGLHYVAGIDEAGRGPLAGPVVAAAVIFPPDSEPIAGIHDSKRLSARQREGLYDEIRAGALAIGIGQVEPIEIDRRNILRATHRAMRQAIGRLKYRVDYLLIDGRGLPDKIYPQRAIPKGDASCYSIAAASIIAKVYRDRLMIAYDPVFPAYGFARHKGYGTRQHRDRIASEGPCPIHRKSFKGVKEHIIDLARSRNMRQIGTQGENIASYYLHQKGYRIRERNFRIGAYGEIDIIAVHNNTLIFVEVKTQRHKVFGPPEQWVDTHKMEQLGDIADGYLSRHPELDLPCRFDVIGVSLLKRGWKIRHLQDAFRL